MARLKVHAWGGLGSQLFALSLAMDTRMASPNRKIQIVLHSSGVTKREPEVSVLYPEFEYLFVDDFESSELVNSPQVSNPVIRFITDLSVRIAALTGFLARENGFGSAHIKPWTRSVRGHYFHRRVKKEFIVDLKRRLELNSSFQNESPSVADDIVLHYRLGDLVALTSKGPVESEILIRLLNQIVDNNDLLILSDSPTLAMERLKSIRISGKVRTKDLSTIDTLLVASNSSMFIGTSSKISYWIILIRLATNPEVINYLPKTDHSIMRILSEDERLIRYYD